MDENTNPFDGAPLHKVGASSIVEGGRLDICVEIDTVDDRRPLDLESCIHFIRCCIIFISSLSVSSSLRPLLTSMVSSAGISTFPEKSWDVWPFRSIKNLTDFLRETISRCKMFTLAIMRSMSFPCSSGTSIGPAVDPITRSET